MNAAPRGHRAGQTAGSGEASGAARRSYGELSALVLAVLRDADQALTAAEVRGRLAGSGVGPLAYTTVVTILSRMHEHGAAERVRVGRAYAYRLITDLAQQAAWRMRQVLDAEDDRAAVLARFVGDLDARDEVVVRDLLSHDAGGPDQSQQRRPHPGPDPRPGSAR